MIKETGRHFLNTRAAMALPSLTGHTEGMNLIQSGPENWFCFIISETEDDSVHLLSLGGFLELMSAE